MFVVAGVTGHVGSVVAERLLAEGQEVKVFVRDAAKGAAWAQRGAAVAVGALDDRAALVAALRGAAGFFVLLPLSHSVPDIFGHQKRLADVIASAVAESGVGHVVQLSSAGADLAEGTGLVKGSHYFENALRATGTNLTAIRAAYFQENIASSLGPARRAGVVPAFSPWADSFMPMVATKDIGALAAASLLAPAGKSETVDIRGPAYSMRQLAEKLGKALGKPLEVVEIPEAGWVPALVQGGMPQPHAEGLAEMYSAFARGAIQPRGDRLVRGTTAIDEIIAAIVR